MPCYSRIRGIRKSKLFQTRLMSLTWPITLAALREKAVQDDPLYLLAGQVGVDGTPNDLPSLSQDRDRIRVAIRIFKDFLFGLAGRVQESSHLPVVQSSSFSSQTISNRVGQGKIDVVSAQKDMVAHGDPFENKLPLIFRHKNQTEVCCPTADIAHKDHITHANLPLPAIATTSDPGIKGRLWFLQKGNARYACHLRGTHCQIPCGRIKGSRYGQEYLLYFQIEIRVFCGNQVIPCIPNMFQ